MATSLLQFPSVTTSSTKHASLCICQASDSVGHQPFISNTTPPLRLELSRRNVFTYGAGLPLLCPFISGPAFGFLEADDDEQLLQKVKEDRRRKLQKREELNTYKKETSSVQAAIYKLSKAGQALDGDDFAGANNVLGSNVDVGWIADVKTALSKVSSTDEERSEAEAFNSALSSLRSAVLKQDLDLSKESFVVSANALEKWSNLTGVAQFLKGL